MDGLEPDIWAKLDQIPGWLSFNAADFTYRLLQTETFRATPGALVEIGVFKGKYMALMAHAAKDQGRRMVGVDGFLAGYQRPLEERWIESARTQMTTNIATGCHSQPVQIVQANTEDLSPRSFAGIIGEACAFLSIDAGHDAHEVYNDFRISCGLLVDGSIIAADDVFNPRVPGVAEGTLRFLGSSEGRELAPFAACGNKLFLCTRRSHARYLEVSQGFLRNASEGYLLSSKTAWEKNTEIGFTPRMFGYEVVPFV